MIEQEAGCGVPRCTSKFRLRGWRLDQVATVQQLPAILAVTGRGAATSVIGDDVPYCVTGTVQPGLRVLCRGMAGPVRVQITALCLASARPW